jgi:hypothetical protein
MEPTGGSHLSFVEDKERGSNGSVFPGWAAGSFSDLGRGVPRGPFFYFVFFFSFFCFLMSFIDFAY